jgi:negative regulator of sigma E activity
MKRRDLTRHFAGHTRRQSAQGSDFSYEDMASGDFSEDYTAEIVGSERLEGVECIKLKCTPTPDGPSYDYIILWAGMDDALTRRIEYYDEGEHLKTLTLSEFQEVEGRTVAMRFEMVSHQKNSRTLMEMTEITFAREPDPSMFTMAALTRPIPPGR